MAVYGTSTMVGVILYTVLVVELVTITMEISKNDII